MPDRTDDIEQFLRNLNKDQFWRLYRTLGQEMPGDENEVRTSFNVWRDRQITRILAIRDYNPKHWDAVISPRLPQSVAAKQLLAFVLGKHPPEVLEFYKQVNPKYATACLHPGMAPDIYRELVDAEHSNRLLWKNALTLAGVNDNEKQTLQVSFAKGEEFDAHSLIVSLIQSAQASIFVADAYALSKSDDLLTMLSKKSASVAVRILTGPFKLTQLEILSAQKFNTQYGGLSLRTNPHFHDRYLNIDNDRIYHSGHTAKDLGKKLSTFTEVQDHAKTKLLTELDTLWNAGTVVI